jgi:hypothetical protein
MIIDKKASTMLVKKNGQRNSKTLPEDEKDFNKM